MEFVQSSQPSRENGRERKKARRKREKRGGRRRRRRINNRNKKFRERIWREWLRTGVHITNYNNNKKKPPLKINYPFHRKTHITRMNFEENFCYLINGGNRGFLKVSIQLIPSHRFTTVKGEIRWNEQYNNVKYTNKNHQTSRKKKTQKYPDGYL